MLHPSHQEQKRGRDGVNTSSRQTTKGFSELSSAPMPHCEAIVRVIAEASGQRAVIESIDVHGRLFRSVVKWANLAGLNDQLF